MSDRWMTPDWILKMFETYHDPCPIDYTVDGLSYDWCKYHDQVFVNPPYSDVKPWVKKALREIEKYPDSTIVMLLKHDSSTSWYGMLKEYGAEFMMIQGRLKFVSPDSDIRRDANFASVLVVLRSGQKPLNHTLEEYC